MSRGRLCSGSTGAAKPSDAAGVRVPAAVDRAGDQRWPNPVLMGAATCTGCCCCLEAALRIPPTGKPG